MGREFIPVPPDKTNAKKVIQEQAEEEGKAMWEILDEVFGSEEPVNSEKNNLEELLFGDKNNGQKKGSGEEDLPDFLK